MLLLTALRKSFGRKDIETILISFYFIMDITMTTNSREYMRKYYAANKEKFREAQRRHQEKKRQQRYLDNPNPRLFDLREDYKTPVKEEFKSIPKKELTYSQKYYAANREMVREKQKAYREKKKRCEKQRAYYAANRDRIAKQQKEYRTRKARTQKLSKSFLGRLYLKIFG